MKGNTSNTNNKKIECYKMVVLSNACFFCVTVLNPKIYKGKRLPLQAKKLRDEHNRRQRQYIGNS